MQRPPVAPLPPRPGSSGEPAGDPQHSARVWRLSCALIQLQAALTEFEQAEGLDAAASYGRTARDVVQGMLAGIESRRGTEDERR